MKTNGAFPSVPQRPRRGPARRGPSPRPASVWVALAALGAVAALQAALALFLARTAQVGWAMYAFAVLVFALLLVGLARRSRLAWLWGRFLPAFLAAALAARLAVAAVHREAGAGVLALVLVGICAPLVATSWALSRRSAFEHFDLVCPECGTPTSVGTTLGFRDARCRRCGAVW